MNRKLRMGMVGGGIGAFIGAVHRMAAALDNEIELVAGAFSSNAEKSTESGKALYLNPNRVYGSWQEMITKEAALPESERIDIISIVTPNNMHYPPAKMALEHGFDVICDKPLAFTVQEAEDLVSVVEKSGRVFALTHNYTGYPMVKEARARVQSGQLGTLRKVVVEYPQGWLAERLEETGQKQADWRTDPARAGISCCMGDIGTHAENLAEYITGLKIKEVCAELTTFVSGRPLDDDGSVLLRLENDVKGILFASQISVGEENALRIRVYGTNGGLEWCQEEPNTLICKYNNRPKEIVRTGWGTLSNAAQANTRIPAGHPEGYLEAFGNIYRNFAKAVKAKRFATEYNAQIHDFPSVKDGLRGMRFIEAVVASSAANAAWVSID